MPDQMRVKIVGIGLNYTTYIRVQAGLIFVALLLAGLSFFYARSLSFAPLPEPTSGLEAAYQAMRIPILWAIKNGWWICLSLAVLEVGETLVATSKAKKRYREEHPEASPPV